MHSRRWQVVAAGVLRSQRRSFAHFGVASGIGAGVTALHASLVPIAGLTGGTFVALVGLGLAARIVTLYWSLYGDRAVSQLAAIVPQLQEAHMQFCEVALHPKSLDVEIKLASAKFERARSRLMRQHGTSNMRALVPHFAVAAVLLSIFVGPLPLVPLEAVGRGPQLGCLVWDPIAVGASLLCLRNVDVALKRRLGFSSRKDKRIHHIRYAAAAASVGWSLACMASVIPPTSGPVTLGIALGGILHNLLYRSRSFRLIFGICDYPATHGTYGDLCASIEEHHQWMRQAFETHTSTVRLQQYQKVKSMLEDMCDQRIRKYVKYLGRWSG